MSYLFEKWDAVSGWIDISEYIEKPDIQIELDLLGTNEIEHNGMSLTLDSKTVSIAEGDYLRYREDNAALNFRNMLFDADTDMGVGSTNWKAGPSSAPIWDKDTTVAGKLYFEMNNQPFNYLVVDVPKLITNGKKYRIKVKARYRSGSNAFLAFGNDNADSDAYFSVTPTSTEITYEGTFDAIDNPWFYIMAFDNGSANNTSQFEIDDIELYIESEPVIFSGFAANLVKSIRTNKIDFDLLSEISDLKSKPIQRVLTGADLRQRLMEGMPDGYALVEMDSTAETMLDGTPSGLSNITYPGDEVIGTDTNNYHCILKHTAQNPDQPITGANYATYWEAGGSAGAAWTHLDKYDVRYFNDLLFDTLAIANAISQGNNHLYCVAVNKELRMYGRNINQSSLALTASKLNDVFADQSEEIITEQFDDYVNDILRGEGALTIGNKVEVDWKKTEHKILSTQQVPLMRLVSYNSVKYGMITAISKKGLMYTYETTKLEQVP